MIGVFDSGFGGLTVMKELLRVLPEYDYIYLGDQARVPYGPRSVETIKKFTERGIKFLFDEGAKIILIACNSATAAALAYLQEKYPEQHILGVIVPSSEAAVKASRYGKIGVVGTRATINSSAYEQELKKALPGIRVYQKATPLLVPLIEEGWYKKPETRMILRKYVRSLKDSHIDTLVLGCTHYPVIEKTFQRIMGKNCVIINSASEQARSLVPYLDKHPDLEKLLEKNKKRIYYTTDCPEIFSTYGSIFLGQMIDGRKIEL